ncbi:hypothetical protein A2U01_0099377, partial [Trifolium medium]|nr:hypothetical protein [Trifolium medium]
WQSDGKVTEKATQAVRKCRKLGSLSESQARDSERQPENGRMFKTIRL